MCYQYNLSLIALITCDVVDDVFPQAQIVVGGRTLVHGCLAVLWEIALLRVYDLRAIGNGMLSLRKMLVICGLVILKCTES